MRERAEEKRGEVEKIEIRQSDLKQAIAMIGKIIDLKSNMPSGRAVLLTGNEGIVKLSAFDFDGSQIHVEIRGMSDDTGRKLFRRCVPFIFLKKILSLAKKKDRIELWAEPGVVGKVEMRVGKTHMSCREPTSEQDFPGSVRTDMLLHDGHEMPLSNDFPEALRYVLPAISTDESRLNINYILLEKGGEVVTTDGHRMHIFRMEQGSGRTDHIPKSVAEAIVQNKPNGSAKFHFVLDDKLYGFRGQSENLMWQIMYLPPGITFPDWRHLYTARGKRFEVKVSELRGTVEKVLKIADEGQLKTQAMIDKMIVVGKLDGEWGVEAKIANVENLSTKFMTVSYEGKYMVDALRVPETDDVVSWNQDEDDSLSPIILEFRDQKKYSAVVMPMRL